MKVTRRGLGKNNLNALLADALGSGFKLQKKSFPDPVKSTESVPVVASSDTSALGLDFLKSNIPEITPKSEFESEFEPEFQSGSESDISVPALNTHVLPESALISEQDLQNSSDESASEYQQLSVTCLQPGKYQPRRDIQDSDLESLTASIRTQGVLQPLIVRKVSENRYEIVAGERRWRAAQRVGLSTVPVLIKDMPDQVAIAIALIENIQRENLNALEEAIALDRLAREFDLTHEKLAETIGKSRAHVSNLLRLLNLNPDVKILLERGDLEMGHAKALLSLTGSKQSHIARQVVAKQLSVRETEALVQKTISDKNHTDFNAQNVNASGTRSHQSSDPNIQALQNKLATKLNTSVLIQHSYKNHKGKLVIHYNSLDELEGILSHMES
jgi:ParB family chromosome partitioning protein